MTPYDRADIIVGELKHRQESPDYYRGRIADAISAARLEALEEAAKIADDFDGSRYDDLFGDEGANAAASDIAEAIRELASQSDSKTTDDPSDTAQQKQELTGKPNQ